MDYLKIFSLLPNFNFNKEIVEDDFYNPTLYKWDGYWILSWVSDEGDSLIEFVGKTPEEVITCTLSFIIVEYPEYYEKNIKNAK